MDYSTKTLYKGLTEMPARKTKPEAETTEKKTVKKNSSAKKTATTEKKSTAEKKTTKTTSKKKKTAEPKPVEKTTAEKLAELCEQVAYNRKAESILRLDMRNMETAQSDFYLICTGLSEPHIGAIADHIQREARTVLGIHPLLCNGERQSRWMIIDFGYITVHIMTQDARDKYQLEELWGDAPRIDVIAKLDSELEKLRKDAEQK